MSKNTLRNVKASLEVHEVKDQLSEAELDAVAGGKQKQSDDPCWTTRDSKGLPCTNEPTSTQTCPIQTV